MPLRKTIGVDSNLKDSQLTNSIPFCYQRISPGISESLALEWAPKFLTHGPRVRERQFPCLILRPGLEIPPWDQEFEPSERFFSWVNASRLRPRRFKHPWNTLSGPIKGIEDGEGVARKYRRRLEVYRASRGEPRMEINNQADQSEVDTESEGTVCT